MKRGVRRLTADAHGPSAQALSEAHRPSGRFERYEQFSNSMFKLLLRLYAGRGTESQFDEGYFDLTANHRKPPIEIAPNGSPAPFSSR